MKKWLIAFIVILVLSVAIFIFIKQNDQDLGANYYYLPKYEAIDIGYPGGGIVYKSPQKGSFDEIIIHGNVIQAIANKQFIDRKSTRLNSSHSTLSRMPSSA